MWGYLKAHELELGDNIIAHYFKMIGLPDWIPEHQEVVHPSLAFPVIPRSPSAESGNVCRPAVALGMLTVPLRAKRVNNRYAHAWCCESQGTFSFGALVGFERSTVLQHPRAVYQRVQASLFPSQEICAQVQPCTQAAWLLAHSIPSCGSS